MKSNKGILIYIGVVILIIVSLSFIINPKKNKEPFLNSQDENKELNLNRGKFIINTSTLLDKIENKLYDFFGNNLLYILNVEPMSKTPFETVKYNNNAKTNDIIYRKYPVNIILFPHYLNEITNVSNINEVRYSYLAVFNDGALYKKDDLSSSLWEGPLKNSYYFNDEENKYVAFRNLTLDKDGRLLGIGTDGNIYIKESSYNKDKSVKKTDILNTPYENNWQPWNKNKDIKLTSLLYLNIDLSDSKKSNKNKEDDEVDENYLGIDFNGRLNVYQYNSSQSSLYINDYYQYYINKSDDRLYRISYDSENYILVINDDLELKRTNTDIKSILNNKLEFDYDTVEGNSKNPNIIYDIIYNNDGKMYGIGSINNVITLLKQENIFYLSPFSLPIKSINKNNNESFFYTNNNIIKYKTGFIKQVEEGVDNLEDAYEKEENEDMTSFRTFCKTQFPDDFIDIETLNKIDEFQGKIEELKKVKEDLINIDKSNNFKSIEDPLNPN